MAKIALLVLVCSVIAFVCADDSTTAAATTAAATTAAASTSEATTSAPDTSTNIIQGVIGAIGDIGKKMNDEEYKKKKEWNEAATGFFTGLFG